MTRPPTVVIVLLSCVISMSPGPRFGVVRASWSGHPDSPFADRMALFKHVLLNDAQWSPVLRQKIKVSVFSLPQYQRTDDNTEVLDRIQLVADERIEDPTALEVIQTMMDKSPWLGTNVNYAAYVLNTAVTCFTYSNVSFVLSLVVDRIALLVFNLRTTVKKDKKNKKKEDEPEDKPEDEPEDKPEDEPEDKPEGNIAGSIKVDKVLDDVRMMLAVFVDKVSAVDGELVFFANGLYDYDSAEKTKDYPILFEVLDLMKQEVDMRLNQSCHPIPRKDVYQYLKKYGNLNDFPLHVLASYTTLEQELAEIDKVINCMLDFYDGLDVDTLSMKTWILILDYRLPISMNINFYVDNNLKTPVKPNSEEVWSNRLKNALKAAKKDKKKEKKKRKKMKSQNLEGREEVKPSKGQPDEALENIILI